MADILWYNGNNSADRDREDKADFERQNPGHTLHVFATVMDGFKALESQRFDAIVTTTGRSAEDGHIRMSGFVIQDRAVELGLPTPRFVFTFHTPSTLTGRVKYNKRPDVPPTIIVGRSHYGDMADIVKNVFPVIGVPEPGRPTPTSNAPGSGPSGVGE